MENGDNLQGARLGSVNNQVRVDRQKLHRLIRQILAPMAAAGSSRKINDLRADDGFNPVAISRLAFFLM
jgi:hypothetical protein